ncbi:MAG TPA: hypothetical protein VHI99_29905 [Vicinamibacterales bacterium]|jgi:hypothetical protein|nr:hypothetical protein [Vicinamibacterales bacterium]
MNQRRAVTIVMIASLAAVTAAQQQPPPPPKESIITKLLRIAGLTVAPTQMRGPGDEVAPGDIWIVALDARAPRALTTGGGYRSPIIGPDGMVYALKGDAVVRLDTQQSQTAPLQKATGVRKLVGFDPATRDEIVVLLESPVAGAPLATLALKNGTLTPLPHDGQSEDERTLVAQIRGQDRSYGDTSVYTRTETKRGLSRTIEWTDVFVKRGSDAPQNVSACDGVNCVQPSLSPDRRSVVFVKTGR